MGMQGQLQSVGKYTFSPRSNAPNLTGGRAVTAGMKLTTGIGEPDDGARFGHGGARHHGAAATLMSAQPDTRGGKPDEANDDEPAGPGPE
ncbi:hypothetical protein CIW52_26500 [Mycolicibacterium sp. P9-64]|uniref:hypothetical protein n=1 Tax=Mycolicibacterium sp. P9-64 TaxID=2024612 RepID=UPI0011EC47A3|nr:hypothetical protein [Mycolicibacterium sp. P9-64]KAA0079704.1 hypothetical protein CIW52_26500 [Mycolicibacterium sp. P9-64]